MNKKDILKALVIFGGGFLLFTFLKPSNKKTLEGLNDLPPTPPPPPPTPTLPSKPKETKPKYTEEDYKNAEIVMNAYSEALKAGENADNLTELNKELMREFNMRCYLDKSNKLVVCDSKGNTIMSN
jgi:hypothetical protein